MRFHLRSYTSTLVPLDFFNGGTASVPSALTCDGRHGGRPSRSRSFKRRWFYFALVFSLFFSARTVAAADGGGAPGSGLLFHLSADHGTNADYSAAGAPGATFASGVTTIPDGARGPALSCGDFQRLAWSAPGNIFAQRGTLSFFWRSRYPVGPTEFPVFRVGFGDHSSWDMTWLRIDYNGRGFDAFVTDASLSRTRVSASLAPFPAPSQWTHIAFSWDETRGVCLYINGKPAAEKRLAAPARYDIALDQFGPHSRIISPYAVQSAYSFTRGGDIDEIRIYDHMLDEAGIARLASEGAGAPVVSTAPVRGLADSRWRDEWYFRHGWDLPGGAPPALDAPATTVRKVEIHDAFDLKRWWWKATDGIRETTWPGVYNRSRLPGRNDYFQLPDWDCYSASGNAITFHLPPEPWNHLEISGAAWGRMELLAFPDGRRTGYDTAAGEIPPYDDTAATVTPLFERPRARERTAHRLERPVTGQRIRFINTMQEEPIGELSACHVTAAAGPASAPRLAWRLGLPGADGLPSSLAALTAHIAGRHPADERAILVAASTGAGASATAAGRVPPAAAGLPLVHILIPNDWNSRDDALDGIAIDLPSLPLAPTHPGGLVPFNIQVKDPLWPARNLLDFSFSLRSDGAATPPRALWLDLRDRLLPPGKSLWLTLASASPDFTPDALAGAEIRFVFKPREAARAEHELDRFTQVRDNYAMQVEEKPRGPKFALWNRFSADLGDLLRVNPTHHLGRLYAAAVGPAAGPVLAPDVPPLPDPADGAPLWAARQVQLLGHVAKFVNWYIDHRQIADGEFGGGIPDDTDLTNTWPGLALMGVDPEKIRSSNLALLEAAYANGMFTRGLNTIQTDELHNYEEGINALGECLIARPSSPLLLERAMETTRALHGITGVNAAGHRHVRSSYYGASRVATEMPWGAARAYAYLTFQPAHLLADYNGNPGARRLLTELADGLLAHRRAGADGRHGIPAIIRFEDDAALAAPVHPYFPWPLFWNAWQWTADPKYLDPVFDGGVTALVNINANAIDILGLRDRVDPARLTAADAGRALVPPGSVSAPDRADGNRTLAGIQRGASFAYLRWQLTGNMALLADTYTAQIRACQLLEYINTEGSLWTDRVGVPTSDLQRARLGGIALARNSIFHGHAVSWRFHAPATAQSLAILIPDATPDSFTLIVCNLDGAPVRATLTGGPVLNPGQWEVTQGIDLDNDHRADTSIQPARTLAFGRDDDIDLVFPARATSVLGFRKTAPGTPYSQRPDLGIEPRDITRRAPGVLGVVVHNLGSVDAPASTLALVDASGAILASAPVPPIPAPLDLYPKTGSVELVFPPDADLAAARLVVDPDHRIEEISRKNNSAPLGETP
ncbi:MAG: hypothetical protein LBI02_07010 [Opitutaceae bacterium]|nr:hypothetical protein [Opitutaceae bacterium]